MNEPRDSYPNEEGRWMRVLGIPMLVAGIFMATVIGTGVHWLIAFCLVFGPGVGVVSLIYLAISSDTNGDNVPTGTAHRRALQLEQRILASERMCVARPIDARA
jgi:hypothetical protein